MAQQQKRARLFVGQLNFQATENDVRNIFAFYGHVLQVNLLRDRATNKSKGSAFVEYGATEEADCAIRCLHNRYFMERDKPLQVSYCEHSELLSDFGWQQAVALHKANRANPLPAIMPNSG
ncbi:putative RNA-binding protein [Trypanosoma vivax]|uniref:Putative RNA-binding protein n=1 Tax=Trypanosoma vivax (strain Y486) TaxID=1055687 RepID=G0U3X2_TRYVY|nr:putative RNA-binding protein [Trypanosoma vivax]CCC52132.1 putative RNA-binding protein [Trypanosoma vivax Y486]